jgi:hypothetical protein
MNEAAPFEQSEYLSEHRVEGIKRLATYVLFERTMKQVDDGVMSREDALAKVALAYPSIMGVEG